MRFSWSRRKAGLCVAAALVIALAASGSAYAAHPPTCKGSEEEPGTLAGRFKGRVIVEGICFVDGGAASVRGDVIVRRGGVLVAAFANNDITGEGKSTLVIYGSLHLEEGSGAYIGCEPEYFECLDDPAARTKDAIHGNIFDHAALGLIIHTSKLRSNIFVSGGGGGDSPASCESHGAFWPFGYYTDFEDNQISGSIHIRGLESCWLGLARNQIEGNVELERDQLADPDAIEVLSNTISGNLACHNNSHMWDSDEHSETELFPRNPEPNTVEGTRGGQCTYASAITEAEYEKGELGTTPF